MKPKAIPKGWLDYSPYGEKVEGTRLFPFKTPLKHELVKNKIPEEKWFTPALLMGSCPNIRAIIDLTDTDKYADRYYNPQEFTRADVIHLKIRIGGGGVVPRMAQIKRFSDVVDGFMEKFSEDPDALIGVHCTHGLNRTGYFICKYMVTRMRFDPMDAITKFQRARGYEMYRQNFLDAIINASLTTATPQRPDYRRHKNTVRPVNRPEYSCASSRQDSGEQRRTDEWRTVQRRPFGRDQMTRHANTVQRRNHSPIRNWRDPEERREPNPWRMAERRPFDMNQMASSSRERNFPNSRARWYYTPNEEYLGPSRNLPPFNNHEYGDRAPRNSNNCDYERLY